MIVGSGDQGSLADQGQPSEPEGGLGLGQNEDKVWRYDHRFTGRWRRVRSDSDTAQRLPNVDEYGDVHPSLSGRCT